jgi:hypothetical protein
MQPPSINTAVSALRFLFTVTLDRPQPCPASHGGAQTAPAAVGPAFLPGLNARRGTL